MRRECEVGELACARAQRLVSRGVERKHGAAKVRYDLPRLEPILKDTYGCMVYQEQVMEIAAVLAGFDDLLQDDIKEAIEFANLCASQVVKKKGVSVISRPKTTADLVKQS